MVPESSPAAGLTHLNLPLRGKEIIQDLQNTTLFFRIYFGVLSVRKPDRGGRKIKSKAINLCERFRLHKGAILRFLRDEHVPFDNNQVIRMIEVREKISGTFRTRLGAECYLRTRSVISTFMKQSLLLLSSLTFTYRGSFQFT